MIPVGRTEVDLEWTGTFSAGLRGLYRAGPLAATQFEAADARRVFPCLDEPGFKAPWAVAVEVPRGTAVLGNGREVRREARGDREVVTFAETPPLAHLPRGPRGRSDGGLRGGTGARRAGADLGDPGEGRPDRLRAGGRRRRAPPARGLLRRPLRLREARPGGPAGLRVRRHGERRPGHLPGDGAAARSRTDLTPGEEADRRGGDPRAGPPVVRQLGDHALVGRPLAQRVVRHLDGLQDRGRLEAGVAHLARLRPGQGGGAGARRASLHAPHPRRGEEPRGHGGGLRPHHLREGRSGAPHDRGLARRGSLPGGDPALHAALRARERRGRRPLVGLAGGLRPAGARAGHLLDPAARATRSVSLRERFEGAPLPATVPLRARRRGSGIWPVPVVLRFADDRGIHEQRLLLRQASRRGGD